MISPPGQGLSRWLAPGSEVASNVPSGEPNGNPEGSAAVPVPARRWRAAAAPAHDHGAAPPPPPPPAASSAAPADHREEADPGEALNAELQARRAGAVRAYFRELFDEPLATAAADESLARFAAATARFTGDEKAADDYLQQIARTTAGVYGLKIDPGLTAE